VAHDARRGYAALEQEMWFMGLCGYSVGIGFPPTWSDAPSFIAEGIHTPLRAGMTFHLPIMFRVPWKFGVGLSETIAITETGCEILTQKSRDLHVAPSL
jgi:Xaa-Pro aminopeptidase